MKLSFFLSLSLAAMVTAEQAGLRKRGLASAGGSVNAGGLCFSKDATVQVFGKGAVTMENLQLGDRVFTGETYQTVYSFGHLDKTRETEFLQIETNAGNSLETTSGHLVYVDGKAAPVRADSIKLGDALEGATVIKIGSVKKTGIFAPLTMDGKVVVDGVKASNYVSLGHVNDPSFIGENIHILSHLGIAPFRLLCTRITPGACESYNENGIPLLLDSMHHFTAWFMNLPVFFQAFMFVAYFAFAGASWMMEMILSPVFVAALTFIGVSFMATGCALQVCGKSQKVKVV